MREELLQLPNFGCYRAIRYSLKTESCLCHVSSVLLKMVGDDFRVFTLLTHRSIRIHHDPRRSNQWHHGAHHQRHHESDFRRGVHRMGTGRTFRIDLALAGAVFFTVYNKFVNVRAFGHALAVVRGKYDDPNHKGEVSHFQALTAALSGTVGVGNIAGVAVAVSLGGPGATFWMIIAGLLGMSSKFAECTLGTKYRRENPDGSVSGGPMYYLREGLAKHKWPNLGKVMAVIFAIACIGGSLGGGNMVQINQATQQLVEVTGGETSIFAQQGWIFGVSWLPS